MTWFQETSRLRRRMSRPSRWTTITVRTLGAPSTAASAVSFMGTISPRRRKPSAVMRTVASQSRSRPAIASLAYPEKIGVKIGGATPHGGCQLAVRQACRDAFFAFEDDRDARWVVPQRRIHVVHTAAEPPRRPGDATRGIEDALVGFAPHEPQIAVYRAPKAVGI